MDKEAPLRPALSVDTAPVRVRSQLRANVNPVHVGGINTKDEGR